MIVIAVSPGAAEADTLTVAVPTIVAPFDEGAIAVTVAVPEPVAVTTPPDVPDVAVATLESLVDHAACVVRSCVAGETPV